ncbi:MAG: glycosyltransferase family 4 protein, partial [Planctomycetota bacterium]
GAAGMYCGSCLHDNALAAALMDLGEDVLLSPIYTPIRTDETDVSERRVFIGGVNAYLQQAIPLLRRTPRWLDGWLDRPGVLRLLAGRGASVDPAKLGAMTVSMLQGDVGNQRKQIAELVEWLGRDARPDVLHLSNSMMVGLARPIANRCDCPIVCSLSGEDIFLEKLVEPHYTKARSLLRERAQDVSAFVALNQYYADFMANYLEVTSDRVHVIPHGLELNGYEGPAERSQHGPVRIAYLARICHDKGLHLLVEACCKLAERQDLPQFELHAAGYLGASDRAYLRQIQSSAARMRRRFHYHGELDRGQKIEFLQAAHIFSTPTIYQESKGLPVLEAWASGAAAVVPDHGAFSELVVQTGGGLLHAPDDANDLAEKLGQLLTDPPLTAQLGESGSVAVKRHFNAQRMAEQTRNLYRRLLAG